LVPSIQVVEPRPEHIPLSFSQERLWFIDRLEGSSQYHLPVVLRLKGNLNKDALAKSIQEIVNRHEVLRTVIRQQAEGQASQYIMRKDAWQLDHVDDAIYEKGEESLQSYIQHLIKAPFDLSKDHMLRASLINIDENEHVLVLTMHHIAADGWSMSILVKEVMELYGSYNEDKDIQLARVPLQYADYAIWQRNYLQGEVLERKLGYWKQKLADVTPLEIPGDYARPAIQSMKGAVRGSG
jgi:NRPS condensation-like uncharacterized protein